VLINLETPAKAIRVVGELKARGVNVKGNFPPPLEQFVMVTAGPVDMMQLFYGVFTEAQQKAA
jgi:hypothetical protein